MGTALGNILNWDYIRHIGLSRWLWRYPLWQLRKRLGRGPIQVRLPHGLALSVPRRSHFSSALFLERGFVDWGSELALVRMMHAGQALLDIGAHFGYYSMIGADAGMQCIAFEPDPRNHPLFGEATAGVKNIELRRLAMSDESGTATFLLHASSAESRIAGRGCDLGRAIQVGVTTVDEVVFSERLAVGGIKIDVEGFDRQVLRGARRTLREKRPVVCTESTWDRELADFAADLDYRVGALVGNPDRAMQFVFEPGQEAQVCPMLFLVPTERTGAMRTVADAIIGATRK